MTIFGSILIYATAGGQIAYIDALFFASGANTQAGLNTVDINLLNTFQQVVLYLCAMTSNPITIHSSVVFLRLYWFEKHFQDMVRDARHRRASLSKSKAKNAEDVGLAEKGVNGRNITVMHGSSGRMTNDGIFIDAKDGLGNGTRRGSQNDVIPEEDEEAIEDGVSESGNGGNGGNGDQNRQQQQPTQITFADKVKRSDGLESGPTKFPSKLSDAEHLAILERQRNVQDDEVLRIPNPRDAERGILPKRLEEGDAFDAEDVDPRDPNPRMRRRSSGVDSQRNSQRPAPPPRQQTIIIEEPERRVRDEIEYEARAIANTFAPLRFRKPRFLQRGNKKLHQENEQHHRPSRSTNKTFSSIRNAWTRESRDDDLTPYLSWQPTLGRNSQFPGLTLEQREELGGIEYRSLRTLALVLVCYFWGFSLFALACLLPWISNPAQNYWGDQVTDFGISRTWWGFFTSNSAFMDLGYTLTPNSMNSFNEAVFILLIMSFLIIIGNTGFPVMLRLVIWILAKLVPRGTGLWEELRFLLDHPRRCFTLLFPSGASWWLFWILVVLNAFDLIVFCVLDVSVSPICFVDYGKAQGQSYVGYPKRDHR
jgi:potassium uptake Trk family protein